MPSDFSAGNLDQLDDTNPGEDYLDPDLAGLGDDVSGDTDLDQLRAELKAEVADTTVLNVDGRPGWSVRYRTDFTGKDLDLLRKRAKDRKFADGIDGVKFGALLLAITCEAIRRRGEDVELEGKVATFQSRAFMAELGTATAVETVRRFYGLDGHVDAAARKLMAEAGWGDDATEADPTE